MCHTDLEINQTEKQQREREGEKTGEGAQPSARPPARQLEGPREDPEAGSLGSSTSLLDHMLDKYLGLVLQCVCVRVCKAPKQMVGDVRLRHTIDFRKQISSLVKQKAPLGHREGKREGETGGMGRRRARRRLSNLCHHQLCERKPGKNKHVREERKRPPTELHYCGGKEREEKRGEESGGKREDRIMGLMPDTQQQCWG